MKIRKISRSLQLCALLSIAVFTFTGFGAKATHFVVSNVSEALKAAPVSQISNTFTNIFPRKRIAATNASVITAKPAAAFAQSWTISATPAFSAISATQTYTFTATNTSTSVNPLGCITITLPVGFFNLTNPQIVSVTGSKVWNASVSGSSIIVQASTAQNRLDGTEVVVFQVTATAPATPSTGLQLCDAKAADNCMGQSFPDPDGGCPAIPVCASPSTFAVTGGGAFCQGGAGVPVGLSGSQTGINYQLVLNGMNIGAPVAGTGAALSFGNQTTAGTYTVVATNAIPACSTFTTNMTGSAIVTVNATPSAFNVTGGGAFCQGGAGVPVGLSSSTIGINYQLVLNGVTNVGSPVAGTGAAINFGNQTSAGTYTVVATNATTSCSATMTGSAIVTVNPSPTAFVVSGGGDFCQGGAGVAVGLSGSQTGVNYQLVRNGSNNVGAPVAGTGAALSFGNQTTAGTYTVVATNATSACQTTMTGNAVVTVSQPPTTATVGGTQTICALGTTAGLGGNIPSVGTGAWSIVSGGTGTFNPNASTPNATFTNTGGTGPVILRWTISSGSCTASSADVTVNLTTPPSTATVGGAQTICALGMTAGLGGNLPVNGTGMWSIISGGTGTFLPKATTPNATFTHTGGAGPVVLRWTISNGSCAVSTADVAITINQPPAIVTNPANQTVVDGSTATFTASASGTPTPTVQWQVSTDGGMTFTNIAGANSTTLSFVATTADNGKFYRAVFTNSCGSVNSVSAKLMVAAVVTPTLEVKVGGQANNSAICIEPGGLTGVEITLTNPNATAVPSLTSTLPAGLTAVAGSCTANVPGTCTVASNGSSVTWDGTLNAGQSVTIFYRAQLATNISQGTQLCIDTTATVGRLPVNTPFCFTVSCTGGIVRSSDQKPGSILIFPYYTSVIGGGAADTRMTISNTGGAKETAYVHVFFIDGVTCQPQDFFICLSPNASFTFTAAEYDPANTGYLLAVAVNKEGVPIRNNTLMGNAFLRTMDFVDNYGAESFAANSSGVASVAGGTATLYFDNVGYDAVPRQFAVQIQSPHDAPGQQIVTASMRGNLNAGQMTGASQTGFGLVINEREAQGSFSGWLGGTCQARGLITLTTPRVPSGLGTLVKQGQTGTVMFNVGAAVGLMMTPRNAPWSGIRNLHKTASTSSTITIPVFFPDC